MSDVNMDLSDLKLNGYPVIKFDMHGNGYTTVMVQKDPDHYDRIEYIVATWYPALGTAWLWGHYHFDKTEADKSFYEVAKRNGART